MIHVFVVVFVVGLLIGILLLFEAGRQLGSRRLARDPEGARIGLGPLEGAVFGLLGLLIAFTFSGAASRFDQRRHFIIDEVNSIRAAYLRVDLLSAAAQPVVRDTMRRYVDTRAALSRAMPDLEAARIELARLKTIQSELWAQAIAASKETPEAAALLPAITSMINMTTTQTAAVLWMHPPLVVFAMLVLLALTCALLAGHGMAGGKTRSWIHMVGFALMMVITIYVIVDLEYPRAGLIRIDPIDQVLAALAEEIK